MADFRYIHLFWWTKQAASFPQIYYTYMYILVYVCTYVQRHTRTLDNVFDTFVKRYRRVVRLIYEQAILH